MLRRVAGRHPLLDVVLDRLDDDDRVVDDEADGQHEAEERQRVDREAEEREEREGADERHRHGEERDERRAPALEEDEDDEHDQADRLEERLDDLADARFDRRRRVERDLVSMPGGKRFSRSAIVSSDVLGDVERVRSRDWKAAMTAAGLPLKVPYCL